MPVETFETRGDDWYEVLDYVDSLINEWMHRHRDVSIAGAAANTFYVTEQRKFYRVVTIIYTEKTP